MNNILNQILFQNIHVSEYFKSFNFLNIVQIGTIDKVLFLHFVKSSKLNALSKQEDGMVEFREIGLNDHSCIDTYVHSCLKPLSNE